MTLAGAALPRRDGTAKVTGAARFAGDHHAEGMLHGVLVGAPVPAGRLRSIDTAEARSLPGIVSVLTHLDLPRLGAPPVPEAASGRVPLQDDEVHHEGQPVALVLGETLEGTQHAASLVRIEVEATGFVPHPGTGGPEPELPRPSGYLIGEPDFGLGDADAALAGAAVTHEAVYVQPSRHANPMEPSATLAEWRDGTLTLIDAAQHVYGVRAVMAAVLDLPPERVRVLARHTGGGFGCKGLVWPHQMLAAVAARMMQRPVRIALTRAQMYSTVGYQPRVVQTIALGAGADGRLEGLSHEAINVTSVVDDYVENAIEASKSAYATDAMRLSQRVQRANVNLPTPMRAPAWGTGLWPLESAMNELAHRLGIDPLDLRLANYADTEPATGRPWSSNRLRECYEQGARAFGWRERPREPQRDGRWLVGHGMSGCSKVCELFPSESQVRLRADGSAVLETGFQDIGSGTLTIFPQIVGDVLGLEPGLVTCLMGDSDLPEAAPTYGSTSTMSVGASVLRAAEDVLAELRRRSGHDLDDAGGPGPGALAAAMRGAGLDELVGRGSFAPDEDSPYALSTFGAVFVEVGVDPDLGQLRLRRAVGRYSVGRIVNPRTAHAQMVGGIVWGWGKATLEASRQDERLGRWLSKDLSGVLLPVNADIPGDIDVDFISEVDEIATPVGGKGIGELGAIGVEAAVADAVFHATGIRVRELPITPAQLA